MSCFNIKLNIFSLKKELIFSFFFYFLINKLKKIDKTHANYFRLVIVMKVHAKFKQNICL